MKAKDLKPGQQFKKSGQRKYRCVVRVIELEDRDDIPENHRGKLLIVLDNCRQMIMDKDSDVIFPPATPNEKNSSDKKIFSPGGSGGSLKKEILKNKNLDGKKVFQRSNVPTKRKNEPYNNNINN